MKPSVPRTAHIRGNAQAKRLVALAEEQAMEVIATLMHENDSDRALMRTIGERMGRRPLSVVAEDDSDIRVLFAIKTRMERRIRKIEDQRKVIAGIGKAAA